MGRHRPSSYGKPLPAHEDADDANKRVLTQSELTARRQEAKAAKVREAAEAAVAPPQSKALRKKLAQIEEKKRKAGEREAVLASLAKNQLSQGHLRLMSSSGALGQAL